MDGYSIHADKISRGRSVEETNSELYLKTIEGETSENPVVNGTYFPGRGETYTPWLEIYCHHLAKFKPPKVVNLSEGGSDEKLFEAKELA